MAAKYWKWGPFNQWDDLNDWALHHEDLETLIGDFPTMAKKFVDEEYAFRQYESLLDRKAAKWLYSDEILNIVKAADIYDCIVFLATELSMGNQTVCNHLIDNKMLLRSHMLSSGAPVLEHDDETQFDQYVSERHGDPIPYPTLDTDIPF